MVDVLAEESIKEVHQEVFAKVNIVFSVGMCIDSWMNVSKEHVDGVVCHAGEEALALESDKVPQLAALAVFFLSAPVQAANCEHSFKDVESFHTKCRPRMKSKTMFGSVAVSHCLGHKCPEDCMANSGTDTKNWFVSDTLCFFWEPY